MKHNGKFIAQRATVVGIEVRFTPDENRNLKKAVERWGVGGQRFGCGNGPDGPVKMQRLSKNFSATLRSQGVLESWSEVLV